MGKRKIPGNKGKDQKRAKALKTGCRDPKTIKKYKSMMSSFEDYAKCLGDGEDLGDGEEEDDDADVDEDVLDDDGKLLPQTIPLKLIIGFLGNLCAEKEAEKANADDPPSSTTSSKKKRVCLSESHVSSHKSAIRWWHKENKVVLPDMFDTETKELLLGYKKKIAKLKQAGKMPQQEGKVALKFGAYKRLGGKLMKLAPILSAATSTSTGKSHVARYV